jgi:2-polyprenyl-3-methyl-5-hydroxy-6-metoxy-1,4-benzoquinol methylase
MSKDETVEKLAAALTSAMSSGDAEKIRVGAGEMRAKKPFLYSGLHDTLSAAINRAKDGKPIEAFIKVVDVRLQSLMNWRQEDNETVAAINRGEIDADAIKPHIRLAPAAYDQFYTDQSAIIGSNRASRVDHDVDSLSFDLPMNINQAYRWTQVISLVETVLGITKLLEAEFQSGGNETLRWMDIGCGTGNFVNRVNPRRFGVQEWDIVGCDRQEGKIEIANRQKARGRSFFTADAFDMLGNYKTRGESFHLVSMFEFLEHLDDPLRFIRQLDTFSPKFVLAASPLEQKMKNPRDVRPDHVHLWSFSLRSWQQMFELAGFEVVYSSEVRVGSYIGGLDWLSVLCGPRRELTGRRQELGDAYARRWKRRPLEQRRSAAAPPR